ncbi:MAG: aspartate ammonia-lyase [Dehalococcoidia bacterium]|nr:aspartate ammonia-lyase [Dehalococcoidia bacterium]
MGDTPDGIRTESDSLGDVRVPAAAYYGAQTQRAVENFPISGLRAHPALIRATALIKRASARANRQLGKLDERLASAIEQAAQEIADGQLRDQFVVDVFQAGAGTSYNMNANEVIANRANEILGGARGMYAPVHPNDHVNMSQSTNDTVPAAIRIAGLELATPLLAALDALAAALEDKAREFGDVLKSGRTHLQDAVPIRLGQEFAGWAWTLRRDRRRIDAAVDCLREINLGGTAVGTGMNTAADYAANVALEFPGLDLHPAANLIAVTQSMSDFAHGSGALRTVALDLIQIANDLRLLSSGPRTGLAEIALPAVQPGSSIMPGKVNPVMAEMTDMVCFQVVGNDTTIALATQAGQLELNVMMPVIAHNLLQSLEILAQAVVALTERCVRGITADRARARRYFESSVGLATVLNPLIGYRAAAKVAQESERTGETILEVVRRRKLLTEEQIGELFDPARLTEPR